MITTTPNNIETYITDLNIDNSESVEFFKSSIVTLLQDENLAYYAKADKIAEAYASLDEKVAYIKSQVQLLQQLRKRLESVRVISKEQVANAMESFGIDKLEGLSVSSLTITPAREESVAKIDILDEKSLIHAGFFTVVLDKEAVEQALYSADPEHHNEVKKYVSVNVQTKSKPASVRINKRKITVQPSQLQQVA